MQWLGQRPPQRTKSVPKNLSPLWGESFRFNGVSLRELSNTPLRLLVCDEDKGRLRELGSTQDDVLGQLEVRLDAARVRSTDPSKHEYKLTFQPAANLTVRRGQQPILEFAVYWTAGGPPAPANALPTATATPAPPPRPPVRPAQVRPGQAEAAARAAVAARSPQGAANVVRKAPLGPRLASPKHLQPYNAPMFAKGAPPMCSCMMAYKRVPKVRRFLLSAAARLLGAMHPTDPTNQSIKIRQSDQEMMWFELHRAGDPSSQPAVLLLPDEPGENETNGTNASKFDPPPPPPKFPEGGGRKL